MKPWKDRQGRFAPLKAVTLALVLLPGLLAGWWLATGQMGAKPLTATLHFTGLWAVRLLLVTLAITPLRLITGLGKLLSIRRMLGVAALGYTLIHFGLYILDQKFDLARVGLEIVLRFYLAIGFLSLLAMAALGATSFDSSIRRLGAARWNRLHALVYPLTLLGLWHGALQSKIDVSEHAIMTGLFLVLMGARGLRRLGQPLDPARLLGLALAGALATIAIEAAWYALVTGVPAARILAANITPGLQPRPALVVGMLSIGLPVLAFLAPRLRRAGGPGLVAQRGS